MTVEPTAPQGRTEARFWLIAIVGTLLVSSAVPAASAAANDWPGFHNDSLHTGLADTKDPLPDSLKVVWKVQMDGDAQASPIVADGIVFMGTDSGKVYAFDARNGQALWGPVTLAEPVLGTMAHDNDRLYVATSSLAGDAGKIYVLDAETGEQIGAEVDLTAGSFGGPMIHDGVLYVGHDGGKMVAYETTSMTKLWEFDTKVTTEGEAPDEAQNDCCLDTTIAAKPIKSVPVHYKGQVFFGSFNQMFFAVDAAGDPGAGTSSMNWVENIHGIVYSSPAIDQKKEMVIVGSYDGKVYAFDVDAEGLAVNCPYTPERDYHPLGNACSDRIYWIYEAGAAAASGSSKVFSSPAIGEKRAYVGDNDGTMHAIWLDSGAGAWNYKTGNDVQSSPAIQGDKIVVGSYDGKVYLFTEDADGKLLGDPFTIQLSDKIHSSPAISDGRIFVATQDGILYALDSPDTEPIEGQTGTIGGTPDLSIQEVTLTPRQPVVGQMLEVAVSVQNTGDGDAAQSVLRMYLGETLMGERNVTLNAGSAKVQTFQVTPSSGDMAFRFIIDEDDAVAESNEDNNQLEQHETASSDGSTEDGGDGGDSGGGDGGDDEAVPGVGLPGLVASFALVAVAMRRIGISRR